MASPWFEPGLFSFLSDLRANNDRDWFAAHKDQYVRDVRDPLLRFIAAFAPHLARLSPHFVADPRPTGGSMFRIHRDTRFAKDKSPYKTAASAFFRHEVGKGVHAPGFYLHLEPGLVMAGAGLWHPEPPVLARVRDAIVESPEAWQDAVGPGRSGTPLALGGESARRVPSGVAADHPLANDLKRKDFVTAVELDQAAACAPDFLERVAAAYGDSAPLVEFLCDALALPY